MILQPAAAAVASLSYSTAAAAVRRGAAIKICRLAPAKKPALPSAILSCPFGTDASLAATSSLACNTSQLYTTYVASRPSFCACSGLWQLQQLARPELVRGQEDGSAGSFIQQPSWASLRLDAATKTPSCERCAGSATALSPLRSSSAPSVSQQPSRCVDSSLRPLSPSPRSCFRSRHRHRSRLLTRCRRCIKGRASSTGGTFGATGTTSRTVRLDASSGEALH